MSVEIPTIYTNEQIKLEAEKLLRDSGQWGVFPVLPNIIAKGLGFDVYNFSPTKDIEHISGAVNHIEKAIYINKNESLRRRIFTIAHEIGHITLHQGRSQDYVDYRDGSNLSQKEREADEFAACLLMPAQAFRSQWEIKKGNIEEIADFFKVSIPAAGMRAFNLKLG